MFAVFKKRGVYQMPTLWKAMQISLSSQVPAVVSYLFGLHLVAALDWRREQREEALIFFSLVGSFGLFK